MSGIFNEKNMMQNLERYLPEGETLTAGIHGIGLEVRTSQIFKNCILEEGRLLPAETGEALQINKSKAASFDVYIGITQNYLILSQCETNEWLYEINEISGPAASDASKITDCITLEEIGTCFPLAGIQSCKVKKVWMGAYNCMVTLKNNNYLKLQLPKLGGLGGGMPHHAEYREAILACLSGKSAG